MTKSDTKLVVYISEEDTKEKNCVTDKPGWYFFGECWTLNGPYSTEKEANSELDKYLKELLEIAD